MIVFKVEDFKRCDFCGKSPKEERVLNYITYFDQNDGLGISRSVEGRRLCDSCARTCNARASTRAGIPVVAEIPCVSCEEPAEYLDVRAGIEDNVYYCYGCMADELINAAVFFDEIRDISDNNDEDEDGEEVPIYGEVSD